MVVLCRLLRLACLRTRLCLLLRYRNPSYVHSFLLVIIPMCSLVLMIGRTLEETSALFEGEDHPEDLQAMGGQAAHMSMRLSKVSFLEPPETKEEPRRNHYEMKKRYRVSDTTSTSTEYNAPHVSMPILKVTEP